MAPAEFGAAEMEGGSWPCGDAPSAGLALWSFLPPVRWIVSRLAVSIVAVSLLTLGNYVGEGVLGKTEKMSELRLADRRIVMPGRDPGSTEAIYSL
ncbi:hypothetical protein [Faunimonas pinastri]|uniref:hypothetical protein n=1 Tax=Faunimonas pinastri TaxID=1855383 RepID=UPI0015A71C78|nr:hypothetical protein [Faunimonas pinastri]